MTVYGAGSPYLAVASSLQLLAVAGVLDYVADAANKTLLGVQAGSLASFANAVAVAVAAGLAFVLIGHFGVFGACLGLLIANMVRAAGAVLAIVWLISAQKSRLSEPTVTVTDPVPIGSIVQGIDKQ